MKSSSVMYASSDDSSCLALRSNVDFVWVESSGFLSVPRRDSLIAVFAAAMVRNALPK